MEEGVTPSNGVILEYSSGEDPAGATGRSAKRPKALPSRKQLLVAMKDAKRQLARATAEVSRLKSVAVARELPRPGGGGSSVGSQEGSARLCSAGTRSEAEKDANRRALLAKCSEEFRRHDLTKVQAIANPFSGGPGQDLDEFLLRFEVRANNCGWTDQDKVLGLAYHLDKGAALAYQRMIANGELADAAFADAVSYLRQKYPQASPSGDQLVSIFRSLKQRKGESVTEFAERFQMALTRTERFQGPMSATAVITRFRASLRESIRAQLRQVKLESLGHQPLDAMIAEATHMEAQLLQEGMLSDAEEEEAPYGGKRRRLGRDDDNDDLDPRPQTAKRVVRAIAEDRDVHAKAVPMVDREAPRPVFDEMGNVLRQVKAIVDTTQAVAVRMQETQAREAEERAQQRAVAPVFQASMFPVQGPPQRQQCFRCGLAGHWASECRAPRPEREVQDRYNRPGIPPRGPPVHRGGQRYGHQQPRQPPPRYQPYRNQGYGDNRRPDGRGHPPEQPAGPQRDRNGQDQRPQRILTDEDRRALARSAEILQGALNVAMAPAAAREPERPN